MDYYKILGVEKTATIDVIKKKYRKLAMEHHPDRGGDPAKFNEINEAYSTLSDPTKRSQYDNPHPEMPFGFSMNSHNIDINEIFSQMFGHNSPFSNNSNIIRTRVNITLKEAYEGNEKILQLNIPNQSVIKVQIPKGVQTGQQIKLDNVIDNKILIVEFGVMVDPRFERHGKDLLSRYDFSVLEMVAGGNLSVETIDGKKVDIKINPGHQPTNLLRIKGKGMIMQNGEIGDLLVLLNPIVPTIVDDDVIASIKTFVKNQKESN